MVTRSVFVTVACLMACLPILAQEGEPKSKLAKEALAKYEKDTAELRKMYQGYNGEFLKTLISRLQEARSQALKDDDLDEAQRIVAKIKEVEEKLKEEEPAKPTSKFEVITARWGTADAWVDVTKQIQTSVKGGRLVLDSPDKLQQRGLYVDPKPNVPKALVIVYSSNGKIQVAVYSAGLPISLPK